MGSYGCKNFCNAEEEKNNFDNFGSNIDFSDSNSKMKNFKNNLKLDVQFDNYNNDSDDKKKIINDEKNQNKKSPIILKAFHDENNFFCIENCRKIRCNKNELKLNFHETVKVILIDSSENIIFEGDWKGKMPNGIGIYNEQTFSYKGEFKDGYRHGKGYLLSNNQTYFYQGDWEEDKQNGQGEEIIKDVLSYKGNFINGEKNGVGAIALSNGGKYEGEFKNNSINGKGRFIWPNNKVYIGEWKNNQIDGFGILFSKAKIHKGFFKDNKKNGKGMTFFLDNENIHTGYFEENEIKGIFLLMYIQEENDKEYKDYLKKKEKKIKNLGEDYNYYKQQKEKNMGNNLMRSSVNFENFNMNVKNSLKDLNINEIKESKDISNFRGNEYNMIKNLHNSNDIDNFDLEPNEKVANLILKYKVCIMKINKENKKEIEVLSDDLCKEYKKSKEFNELYKFFNLYKDK